jgi:hypothetical protein
MVYRPRLDDYGALPIWRSPLSWLRAGRKGRLTSKERDFVLNMTRRLFYGAEPSDRQADWLKAIVRKL